MGASSSISAIRSAFCRKFIAHEMFAARAAMAAAAENLDLVNKI
jgi:hypothetical protein